MSETLRLLVIAELLGLIALPLTATVLPRLPAGAYAFAKPLGLLLLGWVVWLLTSVGVPYGTPLILGVGALLILAALALARSSGSNAATLRSQISGRLWIAAEAVFLTAFAAAALMTSFSPDVWGTEKPMDMALINAINSSTSFPPQDPWLSGEPLDGYYYVGHLLAALWIRVADVQPTVGYNLSLALMFGLSASAAFGLGAGIAAAAGRAPVRSGVMAAVLCLAVGNLAGALKAVEMEEGAGSYPWFEVSRVIPNTINEFPLFSWLLGDLHAHLIAVAFTLTALAFALQWLTSRPAVYDLTAAGIVCGLLYTINSWSYPVVTGLLLLALAATGGITARTALRGGLLMLVSVAAVAPFLLTFSPAAQGLDIVGERRPFGLFLRDHVLMFGLFAWLLVPAVALAFARMRRPWRNFTWGAVALGAAGTVLAEARLAGVLFLAAGVALALSELLRRRTPAPERFVWLLIFGGLTCVLIPEVVFVSDPFAGGPFERMNTVFKLGFQAWLLLSIGAAGAVAISWPRLRRRLQALLAVPALMLLTAALVFPLLGPYARTSGFDRAPTLEGLGWLRARAPGDVAAIAWLRTNAAGNAVVLEASGDDYSPFGHARISTFTGRSTILGWSGHVLQWGEDPGHRREDVAALYRTTSVGSARPLLERYGVDYVVVGSLERTDYGSAGVAKWDALGRRVLDGGGTTVWRISA